MKKSVISIVAVLLVLAMVFVAVGQPQQRGIGRGQRMTQEERIKTIESIEAQLAKLKQAPQTTRPAGNFADMSETERTIFREQMMKVREEQQKVFQSILANVYRLQGRRAPEEEGVQYVIVSTADLKSMQETATTEQATETSQLIQRMIARASGQFGGMRGGQRRGGQ
jgi:flagellin-like protein